MSRTWEALAGGCLGAAAALAAAPAATAASAAATAPAAGAPAAQSAPMSADETFQTHLFGRTIGDAGKAHACFRRAYTARHLAGHPHQNVRTMTLLATGGTDGAASTYTVGLNVTFRKSGAHFETYGDCGHIADEGAGAPEVVTCGVDCDGGEIGVKLKDARSVLVSIPYGARISRVGAEDDSDQRGRFGSDDTLFRLDRTALTDCLPLANDDDEKAALRQGR